MLTSNQPQKRRQTGVVVGHTYPCKALEVIDGDSVRVEVQTDNTVISTEVRLFGLDAPEHGQPFGNDASSALARLVHSHSEWRLEVRASSDRYGRVVGLLYPSTLTRGQSLNREVVHRGMAYWDPEYAPKGEYGIGAAELSARIARRGLWRNPRSGGVRPWDHRWKDDDDDFISEQRERELDAANAKTAELERQLADLTTQSRYSRRERDRANAKMSELERQLMDSITRSSYLRRERDEAQSEQKKLAESVEQYKREVAHLRAELTRVQRLLLEAVVPIRVRLVRWLIRR